MMRKAEKEIKKICWEITEVKWMVPFLSSLGLIFHITVFISPLILFTFDGSKNRIKLLDQLQCEVKQNLLNLLSTDYKIALYAC